MNACNNINVCYTSKGHGIMVVIAEREKGLYILEVASLVGIYGIIKRE